MKIEKIEYPDCTSLYSEVKLKFKLLFLAKNNLKIGDKIKWSFPHNILRGKDIHTTSTESWGVLKEDENGFLYVESDNEFTFAWYEDNGRTGIANRTSRRVQERKAKFFFLSHIK